MAAAAAAAAANAALAQNGLLAGMLGVDGGIDPAFRAQFAANAANIPAQKRGTMSAAKHYQNLCQQEKLQNLFKHPKKPYVASLVLGAAASVVPKKAYMTFWDCLTAMRVHGTIDDAEWLLLSASLENLQQDGIMNEDTTSYTVQDFTAIFAMGFEECLKLPRPEIPAAGVPAGFPAGYDWQMRQLLIQHLPSCVNSALHLKKVDDKAQDALTIAEAALAKANMLANMLATQRNQYEQKLKAMENKLKRPAAGELVGGPELKKLATGLGSAAATKKFTCRGWLKGTCTTSPCPAGEMHSADKQLLQHLKTRPAYKDWLTDERIAALLAEQGLQ